LITTSRCATLTCAAIDSVHSGQHRSNVVLQVLEVVMVKAAIWYVVVSTLALMAVLASAILTTGQGGHDVIAEDAFSRWAVAYLDEGAEQ
jgi:hypothetical protein